MYVGMYSKIMLNQVFHKLGCENTSLSVGKLFVIDSHSFYAERFM